ISLGSYLVPLPKRLKCWARIGNLPFDYVTSEAGWPRIGSERKGTSTNGSMTGKMQSLNTAMSPTFTAYIPMTRYLHGTRQSCLRQPENRSVSGEMGVR